MSAAWGEIILDKFAALGEEIAFIVIVNKAIHPGGAFADIWNSKETIAWSVALFHLYRSSWIGKIVRTSCGKAKGVFRFKVSNQPYLVNQALQPY